MRQRGRQDFGFGLRGMLVSIIRAVPRARYGVARSWQHVLSRPLTWSAHPHRLLTVLKQRAYMDHRVPVMRNLKVLLSM